MNGMLETHDQARAKLGVASPSIATLSGQYGEVQVKGTPEAVNKFIESITADDRAPSSVADLRATVRWLTTECAELRKTVERFSGREKAVKQAIDSMRVVVEDYPT